MTTGILVALALAAAAALAVRRTFAGYPRPAVRFARLAPREVAFLEAAALALFPPGGAVAPSGPEAGVASYVDDYVGRVPPRLRRLMRLLFLFFEQATLVRPAPGRGGRRRFSALEPGQRRAVLERWQESRLYAVRLVFTSLRAILTMGYLADPAVLRALRLAPYDIDTPVCEADLLFPPIGQPRDRVAKTAADLTPPSDGTPLPLDGPLHPDYREKA